MSRAGKRRDEKRNTDKHGLDSSEFHPVVLSAIRAKKSGKCTQTYICSRLCDILYGNTALNGADSVAILSE